MNRIDDPYHLRSFGKVFSEILTLKKCQIGVFWAQPPEQECLELKIYKSHMTHKTIFLKEIYEEFQIRHQKNLKNNF